MIKTIFFDFGGIISGDNNSWNSMHKRIKEITGLTAEELDKIFHKHWEDISINKKDFIIFLEELASASKKTISVEKLLEIYRADTKINSEIVDIMIDLKKKGFRVVLLSNESKLGETFRLKKVEQFIDKVYSSATLRLRKPNPEIFKTVLLIENIKPDEALFIDDRERNTVVSEALGIKSILYKNPKQLIDELSKHLQ